MNRLLRRAGAAALLIVGAATLPASAALFQGWSADITDFSGGSEVSLNGTLIDAVNLGNDNVSGVGVSTTINGVLFKGTQPGAWHEGADSFAEASFVYHGGENYAASGLWESGGTYDTLADSQIYNVDNPNVNAGDGYGVVNLVPGQRYELQVLMLDDRSGIDKTFPLQIQETAFTGSYDTQDSNVTPIEIGYIDGVTIGGAGATQANGEIATIRFSIDPGYNGLLVNSWNGGSYSGMQLRLIPEPASSCLVGLAGLAMAMFWGRRRRPQVV